MTTDFAASTSRRRLLSLRRLAILAAIVAAGGRIESHAATLGPVIALPAGDVDYAQAGRGGAYPHGVHLRSDRPHPAVARIIVPEGQAVSYGSGTLIDARDQFGLVITNWHVVRDGQGDVEVVFPDGFRSKARALKVDADWDLAALVIWRPPAAPVAIAAHAPQTGDQLTICGYGQGVYRAATGRCTQYYAPKIDLPQHMVELDVEARQGDSGGPIFNARGELAGVLFGAGGGTTLGSFGGRVESFLATLAPDIGRAADDALVQRPPRDDDSADGGTAEHAIVAHSARGEESETSRSGRVSNANGGVRMTPVAAGSSVDPRLAEDHGGWRAAPSPDDAPQPRVTSASPSTATTPSHGRAGWFDQLKTALAAVGIVAILSQVLRLAG